MKFSNRYAFAIGFLGWSILLYVYYGIIFSILPNGGPEGLLLIYSVCFFIPAALTLVGLVVFIKIRRQISVGLVAAATLNSVIHLAVAFFSPEHDWTKAFVWMFWMLPPYVYRISWFR